MHARLEPLSSAALLVERHDLAVEHDARGAQAARELAQLRIARREVAEVAALEGHVAVVDEHDRPDPVRLTSYPQASSFLGRPPVFAFIGAIRSGNGS